MQALCPSCRSGPVLPSRRLACSSFTGIPRRRQLFSHRPRAASGETGAAGTAAVVAGAVANPLVLYSLFVLKSTGSGLPPGPYGLYGAAEGVSYLIVVGLVGWSIATKVRTGSGLPGTGLGAVEGFSYLSLVALVLAFGSEYLQKGSLPGVTG